MGKIYSKAEPIYNNSYESEYYIVQAEGGGIAGVSYFPIENCYIAGMVQAYDADGFDPGDAEVFQRVIAVGICAVETSRITNSYILGNH